MRIHLSIIFIFATIINSYACPTINISSTDVNCYLGTNGTASATINGPDAPFTATWSTGQSTTVANGGSTSISNLPAGVYVVSVTIDGTQCAAEEQTITIIQIK